MTQPDAATTIFEENRSRLLRIAYRMLGSMAEAEDIVQDAWIKWRRVDLADVRQPSAFLTRTITRLCLDWMKSARARRESYFGSWLPEPIVEETEEAIPADELSLTLMMALERLSPLERAAFLLHDVFGVSMDEVASTLDRDAPAIRQLAVRARKHVQDARPRFPVDRAEGDRIARAFYEASNSGDVAVLRAMLADGVVLRADGGGKSNAWVNAIVGIDHLVRLFKGLHKKLTTHPPVLLKWAWIDGLPGYISLERDAALQTTALAIEDGLITAIYITRNPDKLAQVQKAIGALPPGETTH